MRVVKRAIRIGVSVSQRRFLLHTSKTSDAKKRRDVFIAAEWSHTLNR
jgi:hypothetical protein